MVKKVVEQENILFRKQNNVCNFNKNQKAIYVLKFPEYNKYSMINL